MDQDPPQCDNARIVGRGWVRGAPVTKIGMTSAKRRYRNGVYSVTLGIFLLLATGILIGEVFNAGKSGLGPTVFAAIMAAASAALTIRCLVAPTITAGHNGVRIRSLLRTRNYSWAEIDRFSVVTRSPGAYNRKVLAITLRNGETRSFTDLNSRPTRPGWVDDAAATLNQHLAALRTTGASLA